MSKPRRDLDYLLDIQDAIDRALEYTSGITWDAYLLEWMTNGRVIYCCSQPENGELY